MREGFPKRLCEASWESGFVPLAMPGGSTSQLRNQTISIHRACLYALFVHPGLSTRLGEKAFIFCEAIMYQTCPRWFVG